IFRPQRPLARCSWRPLASRASLPRAARHESRRWRDYEETRFPDSRFPNFQTPAIRSCTLDRVLLFCPRMKIVGAFGLCVLLFTVFSGDNGLPELLQVRREMRSLGQQIATLRAENAQLKRRAEALRSDPAAIEAVARETLGLARPDELVVTRRR